MRIRFTLDIERRRDDPPPVPEPPDVYDAGTSSTENAGPQPMGFIVPNRDDY